MGLPAWAIGFDRQRNSKLRFPRLTIRHWDTPNLPGGRPWFAQEYELSFWLPIWPRRWINFRVQYSVFPQKPEGGWK